MKRAERLSPVLIRGEYTGDILTTLASDIDVLQRSTAHNVLDAVQDWRTIGACVLVLPLGGARALAVALPAGTSPGPDCR